MKLKEIKVKNYSEIPKDFTGKAIYPNGDVYYFKNGKFHRDGDFPAVEWNDGTKRYFVEGKRHRIGGAAAVWHDGTGHYYINDKIISKEVHDLLVNLMKLKGKNY